MNAQKFKLIILTLIALALVVFSGSKLRFDPDLSKNYQLAYGFVFFVSCLMVVRGIFTIRKVL